MVEKEQYKSQRTTEQLEEDAVRLLQELKRANRQLQAMLIAKLNKRESESGAGVLQDKLE